MDTSEIVVATMPTVASFAGDIFYKLPRCRGPPTFKTLKVPHPPWVEGVEPKPELLIRACASVRQERKKRNQILSIYFLKNKNNR